MTDTPAPDVAFRAADLDWRAEAAESAPLRELAARIDALESAPGAEVLKRNLVRSVWRVPLPDGRRVIVKRDVGAAGSAGGGAAALRAACCA